MRRRRRRSGQSSLCSGLTEGFAKQANRAESNHVKASKRNSD
jgi:hypothetical protein